IARCAGVQNVSRPIVRCHEMSHRTPTMTLVDANRTAYRNQGTAPVSVPAQAWRRSSAYAGVAITVPCSISIRLVTWRIGELVVPTTTRNTNSPHHQSTNYTVTPLVLTIRPRLERGSRYSRSSRLAIGTPRRPRCPPGLPAGG